MCIIIHTEKEREYVEMKNWKKISALALAAAMSLSLLTACGGPADPTPGPESKAPTAESAAPEATPAPNSYGDMTIEELKPLLQTVTQGKLTVATSPDFAPYEFYAIDDSGNPTLAGFDVALAGYVADYLGLELEMVPIDFDGVLMELQTKSVDLGMAGLSPDPDRMGIMDFSDIYYLGGQSFVCLEGNKDQFPDLAATNNPEYQIGAQIGSIQASLANENSPNADIIQLSKVTDIIAELLAGKMDGAYIETVVAESYAKNYPELYIALEVPYDVAGSSIGVQKENPALLAAVNLAIKAALDDGSMDSFVATANEQASGSVYEGLLDESGNVQG
jgi:ABC-type amino acid transport substrate-binding protein